MASALSFLYNNILSIVMLVLLIATGVYLSIKSRFFQFRKFGYCAKNTVGSLLDSKQHEKDSQSVSPFQAVTTALAGTIGTGSIAGVATALVAGGPGAIFWMWISALLGMVTKYSEIVLSLKYRETTKDGAFVGGPMYYIQNGLGKKWLAVAFAIFAMIACIGTGNATQSNSISLVLNNTLQISPYITGAVLTVLVAMVILGGVKRIANINEKLVPFMAVFFVLISVVALCCNFTKLPSALALIFAEAFNLKPVLGGVAGYGIFTAMRYGVGRGVFTNEAGLGSAPIAHAASSAKDPVRQGLWGVFEVFITTIVICTMTALVVLTSDAYQAGFLGGVFAYNGAALSSVAFNEAVPVIGDVGVTVATMFFSLSTILGWAYYGEVSIGYIFQKKRKLAVRIYRMVYVGFTFVGAVVGIEMVWLVADIFNILMALPNLIALVALSKVIVNTTKAHFANQ